MIRRCLKLIPGSTGRAERMVVMTEHSKADNPGVIQTAKNAFINGDMTVALELFRQVGKRDGFRSIALFYIGWINFMLYGEMPESGSASYMEALELASPGVSAEEAGEELCSYLDAASEVYGANRAFSEIDDIISPRGMAVDKFFRFAGVYSEAFSLHYSGIFLKGVDKWINALTLRLFHQAEFSGIRLKFPVELITKKDIENAGSLFSWLDSIYTAILAIDERLGEKFFELQIAFRLDLVGKCVPRLKEVCRDYIYFLPSQLYEVEMEVERAKSYAFLILSMCYSLSSYDTAMKKSFIESVPLLRKLRIVRAVSYGDTSTTETVLPENIYYKMPEEEYQPYIIKAKRLIRDIKLDDKDYAPPPEYESFA